MKVCAKAMPVSVLLATFFIKSKVRTLSFASLAFPKMMNVLHILISQSIFSYPSNGFRPSVRLCTLPSVSRILPCVLHISEIHVCEFVLAIDRIYTSEFFNSPLSDSWKCMILFYFFEKTSIVKYNVVNVSKAFIASSVFYDTSRWKQTSISLSNVSNATEIMFSTKFVCMFEYPFKDFVLHVCILCSRHMRLNMTKNVFPELP